MKAHTRRTKSTAAFPPRDTARKLASSLPFAGLVDEGVMITKNAELLSTFILEPEDLTFAGEAYQIDRLRNLANFSRLLSGGGWTIYADAHRKRLEARTSTERPRSPALARALELTRSELSPSFVSRFYLTVCKDTAETKHTMSSLLFARQGDERAGERLDHDLGVFEEELTEIAGMLRATFKSAVLAGSNELLSYLHEAVSGADHPVRTPEVPFYLDHYLADGTVSFDTVLRYGEWYIVTAGIHDFPAATHAGMMTRVLSLNTEFRVCTRFEYAAKERVKRQMRDLRRFQFQRRKGLGAVAQEAIIKQTSHLEDTEALALTADASAALAQFATGEVTYGRATTTVVVWDKRLETALERLEAIVKAVNDEGFIAKRETLNSPSAYLGSIPGNTHYNARRPILSTKNLAHFFLLSSPWTGDPVDRHLERVTGVSAPLVVGKTANSPFYVNLHYGDVGHTLVFGPTGSGKSLLLAMLAGSWLKYPRSRVVFFDKDRSSFWACAHSGGTFIEVRREEESFKLNPFAHVERGPEEVKFVTDLVTHYLELAKFPLAPQSASKIHAAVVSVAQTRRELRGWSLFVTALQDPEMREALRAFVGDGHYAGLFGDGEDALSDTRWITFEMGELMRSSGDAIVPMVFHYLFHRVEERFAVDEPTLIVVDEAWAFLDSPVVASILRGLLKTARKMGAAVVLSTQEVADARSSEVFHTIATNCPTKILLPNSLATQPATAALYREIGLIDTDLKVLEGARPKRDYLYVNPEAHQLFRLDVSEEELALLTKAEVPQRLENLFPDARLGELKEHPA